MFCDSITRQAVRLFHDDSKHYDAEKGEIGVIFRDMYNVMKGRAFYLQEHLNFTDGENINMHINLDGYANHVY